MMTKHPTLPNDERQAAVERNFIAIGEAIKDLGRALDLATPDPSGPWRHPARFRDFLAHKYDEGISHPDAFIGVEMPPFRYQRYRNCGPKKPGPPPGVPLSLSVTERK